MNRPLIPLSGTYTINQTLPDAGTYFAESFLLLNLAGVGGPTTFRVANGQTFSEQTPPLTVSGTAAAPVIFQSAGGAAHALPLAPGVCSLRLGHRAGHHCEEARGRIAAPRFNPKPRSRAGCGVLGFTADQ